MTSVNVAVCGSVDSGKSTLLGVLKTGQLDNGNGFAREQIITLKHERESGRTSNVNLILVPNPKPMEGQIGQLRLLDLAGHEKYLRTTLRGLTNYYPDYAILVISSVKGLTQITRDHFSICRNLNIPVIIVVTKIDICPAEVLQQTMESIRLLTKMMQIKFMYEFSDESTAKKALDAFTINPTSVVPLIKISNVKGDGIDILKYALFNLQDINITSIKRNQSIQKFAEKQGFKQLFFVYTPYFVKGVGIVLHGINKMGPITVGDKIWVGPISGLGRYIEVRVRSIHNDFTQSIEVLESGKCGCLAIKSIDPKIELYKRMFNHGRVVTDKPLLVNKIKADIFIMNHSTTINQNYTTYIHCANVSVTAKLIEGDNFPLRSQKISSVVFEFITPQFIYPDAKLLFRDGNIKGIGVVREIFV